MLVRILVGGLAALLCFVGSVTRASAETMPLDAQAYRAALSSPLTRLTLMNLGAPESQLDDTGQRFANKQQRLKIAGWTLFVPGLITNLVGTGLMANGGFDNFEVAAVLSGVGLGMVLSGIGVLTARGVRRRRHAKRTRVALGLRSLRAEF